LLLAVNKGRKQFCVIISNAGNNRQLGSLIESKSI
jgi:hypothetical protein